MKPNMKSDKKEKKILRVTRYEQHYSFIDLDKDIKNVSPQLYRKIVDGVTIKGDEAMKIMEDNGLDWECLPATESFADVEDFELYCI